MGGVIDRHHDTGEVADVTAPCGTVFQMLAPCEGCGPSLLLFAMSGTDTLTSAPYNCVGRILHAQGWNVVSLDLPCHGADRRAGEPEGIAGWAVRLAAGEDIVAAFRQRVNGVVAHLVSSGIADPHRIAAAGTSRGGFMAFHAAAANVSLRAVAAFSPVTDLLALTEFAGQHSNPLVRKLALTNAAEPLAGRAIWITIGDADARVGTERAVAFSRALLPAGPPSPVPVDVILRLVPVAGHRSCPEWHEDAAAWLKARMARSAIPNAADKEGEYRQ